MRSSVTAAGPGAVFAAGFFPMVVEYPKVDGKQVLVD